MISVSRFRTQEHAVALGRTLPLEMQAHPSRGAISLEVSHSLTTLVAHVPSFEEALSGTPQFPR